MEPTSRNYFFVVVAVEVACSEIVIGKNTVAPPVWWCTATVPELRRQRQEGRECEGNLGYIERPCLNNNKIKAREMLP